jgi:hypothetical protein
VINQFLFSLSNLFSKQLKSKKNMKKFLAIKKMIIVTACVGGFISCEKEPQLTNESTPGTVFRKPSGGGGGGGTGSPASFSGQATAIKANVLDIVTTLSETSPLPSAGGAEECNLLVGSVPNVLTAKVLHAACVGQGDRSRAEAAVADLDLFCGYNSISAAFIMSRAQAMCGPSVTGSSQIIGLTVNGKSIYCDGTPNQTILCIGGKIVLNEQSSSVSGGYGAITVTAIHIMINGVADIVVSKSHADINCPKGSILCSGGDFMTGGGWITGTPGGAKGNFGVAGGIKNGAYWGHLTYNDHNSGGPKIKANAITGYEVVNATTRKIKGLCEVDGSGSYVFSVTIADNGEPGSNDTFNLSVANGYNASGVLGGGNIQLHMPCK